MTRITLFFFIVLSMSSYSQIDSAYIYIVDLKIFSDKDSTIGKSIPYSLASRLDTLAFNNQSEFYPIGLPKDTKIDLLLYLDSNVVKIEDIGSMMKFELWHYINIELSYIDQKCMFAAFWNPYGELVSNGQIDEYVNDEGKLFEGVICHYSEIGSYYRIEYLNKPPECKLFAK